MRYNFLEHINWTVLLFSLCLAAGMWYSVTIRDRVDAQLEVRLDYKRIPDNLVVTDGLVNQVRVRLRGPEALVRGINPQNLIQVMNLSNIRKGSNTIPLVPEQWSAGLRAFEILEVTPPRLTLEVDNLQERQIPVIPTTSSQLKSTVQQVERLQSIPPLVTVRGPESIVANMKSLPITIKLDPTAPAGEYNLTLPLDTPSLVSAHPPTVRVSYSITSTRKQLTLERPITIDAANKKNYNASPASLLLYVEVPEALARNSVYLNKATVNVTPPPLEAGESATAPVRFDLPEGMSLVAPQAADITVTKIKK